MPLSRCVLCSEGLMLPLDVEGEIELRCSNCGAPELVLSDDPPRTSHEAAIVACCILGACLVLLGYLVGFLTFR